MRFNTFLFFSFSRVRAFHCVFFECVCVSPTHHPSTLALCALCVCSRDEQQIERRRRRFTERFADFKVVPSNKHIFCEIASLFCVSEAF